MEESKSKYAGLSKGQIKKLKEKEKKEREAKELAEQLGEEPPKTEQAEAETSGNQEKTKEQKLEQKPSEEENNEGEAGKYAGMSKAQKKKAMQKAKAEAEAQAAAEGGETKEEPEKGKGGKKLTGKRAEIAAAIKAKQDEERRIKEEEERLQREEDERIKREEEKEKEEKAKQQEIKAAKKQAKKERQKQEKSKEQQEKERIAEERRQAILEAKGIKAGEEEDGEEKKISYKNKNKGKKKKGAAANEEEKKEEQEQKKEQPEESDQEEEPDNFKPKEKMTKKEQPKEEQLEEISDWEDDGAMDKAVNMIQTEAQTPTKDAEVSSGEEEEVKKTTKKEAQPKNKNKKPKKEEQVEEITGNALTGNFEGKRKVIVREKKKPVKGGKTNKLRCPIVCIMGHVDTGKTLILDKLRKTKVQAGEAGGITQQIGATYFPPENLQNHLTNIAHHKEIELELPGFLVIDTPGHESFSNLRSRGSSLCDLAVLVVDIMHGLEQQTLESLNMLKQKGVKFCVALNKIDRLNQWKPQEGMNSRDTLKAQGAATQQHFQKQLEKTMLEFNEQGFNVSLYWENESPEDTLSLVPTSAITGEGLSDLITDLCNNGQTSERENLTEKPTEFECTVLEVKVIEGLGTTIDIVLVNGLLKVNDTIVISGLNGPIRTNIRALLTPYPMKEMRVKGEYMHHQKLKGAIGIKISAPGLENAIPGSELFRCKNEEEVQDAIDMIEGDLVDILDKYVDKTQEGVVVQASTIGSLEALLEFLKVSKIPVSAVNIGPVHKKDILKAMRNIGGDKQASSTEKKKEYASMLCFDVRVTPEATKFADEEGIKIFTANIIYNLFDDFIAYVDVCRNERKGELGTKAVFPCILEMVKDACFNASNPIVIGVKVVEGVLKIGTPLCVPDRDNLRLGFVQSIEQNKKPIQAARAMNGDVAVKIANDGSVQYRRHFDDKAQICSQISRDSIDALKEFFKDEMKDEDWRTCIKLKKRFGIV